MIRSAATLAGLAVAFGAFGAHGLRDHLANAGQAANFQTAVRYQMWHALALLACAALSTEASRPAAAAWCFAVGSAIFSATLYGIALSGVRWLGAITPVGGMLMIVGWVLLAVFATRQHQGATAPPS